MKAAGYWSRFSVKPEKAERQILIWCDGLASVLYRTGQSERWHTDEGHEFTWKALDESCDAWTWIVDPSDSS